MEYYTWSKILDQDQSNILFVLYVLIMALVGKKLSQWQDRLEICQKIYTTEFLGQKIYTLKVRKLRLFLLKDKQRECISSSYFSSFLVKIQLSV